MRSAATAALQARAASSHAQLQQQPSHPLQALASATSGLAPGLLSKGDTLLTDHTQQQLLESPSASALDAHTDARHVSYALGQEEARSSKHSVATEADQLSSALAGQQQQQQQTLHEGPNLPWSDDGEADNSRLQEQQQQSLEVPVSGIQSSDAGESAEGGMEGAAGGQDEAAKAAYRQWSASFEARMVSCRASVPAHLLTSLVSLPQNTALMLCSNVMGYNCILQIEKEKKSSRFSAIRMGAS